MIYDPLELSYSKVKAYLHCPALYRFLYVEQKRGPYTAMSSLGTSVHRALEAFHSRPGDIDDLLESYNANWIGAGYAGPQEAMDCYQKGLGMLSRYWELEKDRKSAVRYVEKDFGFKFGKWTVRGTIDRIDSLADGSWEVIDYKTGLEVKTPGQVAESLQMNMYGMGASRGLGITPALLTIFYVARGETVSCPYDPAGGEKFLGILRETGEKILGGDFSPDYSFCGVCGINKICARAGVPENGGGK